MKIKLGNKVELTIWDSVWDSVDNSVWGLVHIPVMNSAEENI